MSVKAYKIFGPDWKCRDFQYKVGETYEEPESDIQLCKKGFHASQSFMHASEYYKINETNKYAEVELSGKIIEKKNDKYVSSKIRIIREISYNEVIKMCNGECNIRTDIKIYFKDGKYHCENGPAAIEYKDCKIVREEYYVNGKCHRVEGPAIIYYEDGEIDQEEYYVNGELHRLEGPAIIKYEDGKIVCEGYYTNGHPHCENGPAIIYYKDGKIVCEGYYTNGHPHCENGPAIIYYKDGKIVCEEYYVNGVKHRENGPAKIWYDEYGKMFRKEYWINGKSCIKIYQRLKNAIFSNNY